jgi:hypothetical protein
MQGLASVAARMNETQRATVNDLTRRFVYSGGVPHLVCDPKKSRIMSNPIAGGQLHVLVPSKDTFLGGYDDMNGRFKVVERTIYPAEYIVNLQRKFVDSDSGDVGLMELRSIFDVEHQYGERDADSYDLAFDYFHVLHPPIDKCPFGLEKTYASRTPGNLNATAYQACPTCRLAELKSKDCDERIYQASQKLDSAVLQALREELILANEKAISFAEIQISVTEAELEGASHGQIGAKRSRNEIDLVYLKMLHRQVDAQKDREIQQQIAVMSAAMQNAMLPALQNTQPVQVVTTDADGIVLTGKDKEDYEAWQKKREQMAKARLAKTTKENNSEHKDNGSGGNESTVE